MKAKNLRLQPIYIHREIQFVKSVEHLKFESNSQTQFSRNLQPSSIVDEPRFVLVFIQLLRILFQHSFTQNPFQIVGDFRAISQYIDSDSQ